MARFLSGENRRLMNCSDCDNRLWTAPEILRDVPDVNYQVADIYSFAVIISEILNNARAYSDLDASSEGPVAILPSGLLYPRQIQITALFWCAPGFRAKHTTNLH